MDASFQFSSEDVVKAVCEAKTGPFFGVKPCGGMKNGIWPSCGDDGMLKEVTMPQIPNGHYPNQSHPAGGQLQVAVVRKPAALTLTLECR